MPEKGIFFPYNALQLIKVFNDFLPEKKVILIFVKLSEKKKKEKTVKR